MLRRCPIARPAVFARVLPKIFQMAAAIGRISSRSTVRTGDSVGSFNSASAVDLHIPIVVDGVDYGAPLENLKSAMKEAKLASVDLWIGGSSAPVAKLVVPVLKPKAFIPVHWDGLFGAFEAGVPKPYADSGVEAFLTAAGVTVVKPAQYMDKWRLDRNGVRALANNEVKKALGFN